MPKIFLLSLCLLLLAGCSQGNPGDSDTGDSITMPDSVETSVEASNVPFREPSDVEYIPVADGTLVFTSDYVVIDHSNASKGYIMVEYVGTHIGKIKFRIEDAAGVQYTYDLHDKEGYQVFSLHSGSGDYTFKTFEQASGSEYYNVDTQTLTVTIEDELLPYLYPNQYVDFSSTSDAVLKAGELYSYTETDLDFIAAVFYYIMDVVAYDHDKAEQAVNGEIAGYLPVIDETLSSGMGICFDYASLMTAMLRSQGVPTRLVIGYAGEVYHAWISVHTAETGWIEDVIEFDGEQWKLMDPTFTDGGADSTYTGDGENYAEKYIY